MQIGRQLNRNTPRLTDEDYSDGFKDLVSFALDSNPASRPSMSDIMSHSYIVESEEEYPTSSLSELVRIYYQWSQRGGQRISLFNPGGAAAAQLDTGDFSDEDWNFSTTDNFERRFSVLDLDQLAASLAEMEEKIDDGEPDPTAEQDTEPNPGEMTSDQKANFDERVKRGATAMEGLFDEGKPDYKYETKNDFVPVEEKQTSDLPLRTVTDRSSVMSTFIDIDIGSYDSSHYAAGSVSAQPFQLADADTIKANRSSGRQNRTSNEEWSTSSGSEDGDDSDNLTEKRHSGPRPPTMEWKFPTFAPPAEEESDGGSEPSQESQQAEPVTAEKRATMQWTFPVMTQNAGTISEPLPDIPEADVKDTARPPATAIRTSSISNSSTIRGLDLGEPGEARPSSSSASSFSDISDSEYDPFRFDRPSTPRAHNSPQREHFFNHEFPAMLNSAGYSDYEPSSALDGPGPDEEDTHPLWHNNTSITDPESQPESFQTDVSSTLSSPISDQLSAAKRIPPPVINDDIEPIEFPIITPPPIESLTEGADDVVVSNELDKLLGDLLDSLKLTGDALSRVNVGHEVNGSRLTPENVE